jgi:hypothetical protein
MTSANDEVLLNLVQLSDVEVFYLNECLQNKEYMTREDSLNTIIELEHFYTLIKMNFDGNQVPSAMVDKAWHHHILNTQMYNTFSRQHFGMEIVHHVPFWSGNTENMEKISSVDEEQEFLKQYNTIVSMFGEENVNKTVWFTNEDELDRLLSKKTMHIEF